MSEKNLKCLVIIKNEKTNLLCRKIIIADNFITRFKGLMLKKNLSDDEGLLLTRTKYIHTFWMFRPIDIIYLKYKSDQKYMVVDYEKKKTPWRIGKFTSGATDVLELKQGSIDKNNIMIGAILRFMM